MELFAKDIYRIKNQLTLNHNQINVLFTLYQPLIGSLAVALYMTFLCDQENIKDKKHQELCTKMDISIVDLERSRIKLEQFGLCKTYYSTKEYVQYIYDIQEPLDAEKFLNHYLFGILYKKAVGILEYEHQKSLYQKSTLNNNYEEITEQLKVSDITYINTQEMNDFIQTRKTLDQAILPSNFDYSLFLKGMSALVFPKKLRTDQNLTYIGKLAGVYGISEMRMRVLVSRCVDVENTTLNINRLAQLARKEKPVVTDLNISGYNLPPLLFLQEKQLGVPVSNNDKKLLEELVNDIELSPEVVNILIEYVLDSNNKILVRDYVLKVAATWKMHGVTNINQAQTLIKTLYRSNKEKEMRGATIKQAVTLKQKTNTIVSESEEQEIREEFDTILKKIGGSHEKN